MSGFSFIQMTNLSHMSWKYWIMINYEKTKQKQTNKQKKRGWKSKLRLDKIDWSIDWLIWIDSLTLNGSVTWLANHNL